MKIYLVKTNDYVSYDAHDAVVVIAKNAQDAIILSKEICSDFGNNLSITEIGTANKNQNRGEVLSSYNPG